MTTPWMQTRGGQAIELLGDEPIVLDIEDAAKSLARIARFVGHTHGFLSYSVAQHCVLVSRDPELAGPNRFLGLVHDLHECVIGDVTSPVKRALKELGDGGAFDFLDHGIMRRVFAGLGLPITDPLLPRVVVNADLRALLTERRDLMGDHQAKPWRVGEGLEPWPEKIVAWDAAEAERAFLDRFAELRSGTNAGGGRDGA